MGRSILAGLHSHMLGLEDSKKTSEEGLAVQLMTLDLPVDLMGVALGAKLLGHCAGLGLTTVPHRAACR